MRYPKKDPYKYEVGDRLILARWMGKGMPALDTAVEILALDGPGCWSGPSLADGRRHWEPAAYRVRVLETGEEFPAGEAAMRRPPVVHAGVR